MKYATITDIDFAIAVLKMSASKIPEDSYAKNRVTVMTNHVVFELEDIKKQLEKEIELDKAKSKFELPNAHGAWE